MIGENLAFWKSSTNFTIKDIMDRTGISKKTWNNYVVGRHLPDTAFLQKMYVVFNVSPNWLLLNIGEMIIK